MSEEEHTGDEFLSVRVPAELYAALKRIAQEEDRTIAAEVRRALRAHVDADIAARNA